MGADAHRDSVVFRCLNCGAELSVPASADRGKFRCPSCEAVMRAPAPRGATAAQLASEGARAGPDLPWGTVAATIWLLLVAGAVAICTLLVCGAWAAIPLDGAGMRILACFNCLVGASLVGFPFWLEASAVLELSMLGRVGGSARQARFSWLICPGSVVQAQYALALFAGMGLLLGAVIACGCVSFMFGVVGLLWLFPLAAVVVFPVQLLLAVRRALAAVGGEETPRPGPLPRQTAVALHRVGLVCLHGGMLIAYLQFVFALKGVPQGPQFLSYISLPVLALWAGLLVAQSCADGPHSGRFLWVALTITVACLMFGIPQHGVSVVIVPVLIMLYGGFLTCAGGAEFMLPAAMVISILRTERAASGRPDDEEASYGKELSELSVWPARCVVLLTVFTAISLLSLDLRRNAVLAVGLVGWFLVASLRLIAHSCLADLLSTVEHHFAGPRRQTRASRAGASEVEGAKGARPMAADSAPQMHTAPGTGAASPAASAAPPPALPRASPAREAPAVPQTEPGTGPSACPKCGAKLFRLEGKLLPCMTCGFDPDTHPSGRGA